MPRGKEQQAGIDYEERMAKVIGARVQPGSGNQWYAKLDLSGRGMLWSLKHTGKDFFRLSRAIMLEGIKAAVDEGCIPGWLVDIAGRDYVIMLSEDFMMLMEEEHKVVKQSKSRARHRAAAVPALLRDQEEDDDADD